MNAHTLRKIASDLMAAIADEEFDLDAVRLAATRLNAQAEMLDERLEA